MILGTAVILGGTFAFRWWLNSRLELRKLDAIEQEKKEWLELQKSHVENDTQRMEIFARALQQQPLLQEIDAATENARHQMVKAVTDEHGGSVGGIPIASDVGAEIVSQRRQQGQDVRLAGQYRVDRVNTTAEDGFRVTLTEVANGATVTAAMQDALVSEDHRRLIREAEWSKSAVFVEMAARRLRNRIVDATVVNVREMEPTAVRDGS